MCRVGGAIADGVLLNWMLPAQAAAARRWVREGADEVPYHSALDPPIARVLAESDATSLLAAAIAAAP